jgi:hypothetical protein
MRLGGWLDLPSEAACWGETVGLVNKLVVSDDIRDGSSVGAVSEVEERAPKDRRGSDLAGCNTAAGNSAVGLGVDSGRSGGSGGGGLIAEVDVRCRGNGSTGIAGNCGGLSEARLSVIQGGCEVSILEKVLLLPCRLPFPFGVGVVVSLSLSGLECSVDLLPNDIRLVPPINTGLLSVPSPRSRSFPLCLSLETDRTIR